MTDQLRQDLEALYDSLQKGWAQYGANGFPHAADAHYGDGSGCLSQQMARIVGYGNLTQEASDRYCAMRNALGLSRGLFAWNDDKDRTWDDVKELVKDTIGKL